MRRIVRCPDCGFQVEVPEGVAVGERFECPNCAGTYLRLGESADHFTATRVHVASCPDCEGKIELGTDPRPGDAYSCCGRQYVLTYAYGSYALEPKADHQGE